MWMPHISDIGVKGRERFREGKYLDSRQPSLPVLTETDDWYWTPAVSNGTDRKIKRREGDSTFQQYPAQKVIWVDCDESFNDKLLMSLRPSYVWETSPGHKQAVWLMREPLQPSEYHRDGFMGMLAHALGGDKSGVDIGQLLRVPGSWHHKRKPFHGRLLAQPGTVYTRSQVLRRVAQGLGFPAGLASELAADDPYGDRSKLLWKFARQAAELGLDQALTFKLIKATKWNKWQDDPDRLKDDIGRAYDAQPTKKEKPKPATNPIEDDEVTEDSVGAWEMAEVSDFGPIIRKPMPWLVKGIIPEGGCGLLVAPPKVGKTRVAMELALGLASGRKPLGISVAKPQPVGFFSLEDGEYLFSTRLNDGINKTRGREGYHWDGRIVVDKQGHMTWEPPKPLQLLTRFDPIDLSDGNDKQRLYETIEKYGLKIVILDTLSMSIGKAEVSSSTDMYSILKDLKIIAKETGCAVMFIHHTRKRVFEKGESIQEMILGSTALHGWSDFIMNLAPPEEDSQLLRLGVQTKMGNDLHYLNTQLKIIRRPEPEEVET
ncbi:RecA-like DNA recombinase [Microbacterium phage MonChoix]|uniref:RecA-like DNA recombinase n=1 Tax=Microbacterium phage MonChoix TaxID=2590880 RepID=A0A4Y6ED35_9CAUD|nr:RecA-like DNA recombinase [Microbacterium phage MonChoix]QDF15997.1 RecA-like DNA recombinase [Microbacterium phage MonChoix]